MQLNFYQAAAALQVTNGLIEELISFKIGAKKDDPARRQDIYGPYEEFTRLKTGKVPPSYYEPGDAEPWGLLVEDSRRNILWQVLSGLMDRQPDFAASYMALALDNRLSDDDYAKELGALHKDWRRYLEHAGLIGGHHHKAMKHVFDQVACPACSLLTALACRDAGMNALFTRMLPLKLAERRQLLADQGLAPLLNIMIPGKETLKRDPNN